MIKSLSNKASYNEGQHFLQQKIQFLNNENTEMDKIESEKLVQMKAETENCSHVDESSKKTRGKSKVTAKAPIFDSPYMSNSETNRVAIFGKKDAIKLKAFTKTTTNLRRCQRSGLLGEKSEPTNFFKTRKSRTDSINSNELNNLTEGRSNTPHDQKLINP